jgi:hypothetical protein
LFVKKKLTFTKNKGFAIVPKTRKNISPKKRWGSAGWTQPLAFENHENVEKVEFPRFFDFVRLNGPDPGSQKMRNVCPVISVLSKPSQLQ